MTDADAVGEMLDGLTPWQLALVVQRIWPVGAGLRAGGITGGDRSARMAAEACACRLEDAGDVARDFAALRLAGDMAVEDGPHELFGRALGAPQAFRRLELAATADGHVATFTIRMACPDGTEADLVLSRYETRSRGGFTRRLDALGRGL